MGTAYVVKASNTYPEVVLDKAVQAKKSLYIFGCKTIQNINSDLLVNRIHTEYTALFVMTPIS